MRNTKAGAGAAVVKHVLGCLALALMVVAGGRVVAPQPGQGPGDPVQTAEARKANGMRNPPELRAMQLLERDQPELAPHVRFEWEPVPGAREYLLSGHWATAQSWTMQSRQFHVTPASATSWQRDRVSFDVALPQGTHSWNLVALIGPQGTGDFATPAPISFALR